MTHFASTKISRSRLNIMSCPGNCHLYCFIALVSFFSILNSGLVISLQVDVLVTTAGGVEEDLIKCLGHTYKGDFSLSGAFLRSKGLNRIGNLYIPNANYCKFEDWIIPILDQMLEEQKAEVLSLNFYD